MKKKFGFIAVLLLLVSALVATSYFSKNSSHFFSSQQRRHPSAMEVDEEKGLPPLIIEPLEEVPSSSQKANK